MKKVFWPIIQSDKRPARPDGTCFYCEAPLGSEHNIGCVIRIQTIVLRVSGDIEPAREVIYEMPEHWSLDYIADYLNGSGIQYVWSGLENRGLGNWGASIEVLRFASHQDEDSLVNICNEKSCSA